MYSEYENEYWFFNLVKIYLNVVYEKALLWQSSESMANFSFGLKSLSHYDISITSSFYLMLSFSSEDKYVMIEGRRSEHYDSQ
jgi:hypothetical protein